MRFHHSEAYFKPRKKKFVASSVKNWLPDSLWWSFSTSVIYPIIQRWDSFCDSSQFEHSSFYFICVKSFETTDEVCNVLERYFMGFHRSKADLKPSKKFRCEFSKRLASRLFKLGAIIKWYPPLYYGVYHRSWKWPSQWVCKPIFLLNSQRNFLLGLRSAFERWNLMK